MLFFKTNVFFYILQYSCADTIALLLQDCKSTYQSSYATSLATSRPGLTQNYEHKIEEGITFLKEKAVGLKAYCKYLRPVKPTLNVDLDSEYGAQVAAVVGLVNTESYLRIYTTSKKADEIFAEVNKQFAAKMCDYCVSMAPNY